MLKNNYNYILNGISHEIEIKSNIKIQQDPLDEIILISNKFMLKFINDLFDYNSIEYILLGNCLLGCEIFQGINIFKNDIELMTLKNNFVKIKNLREYLESNNFNIRFYDNHIEISSKFFKNYNCIVNIFLLENVKKNLILQKNNIFSFDLYDIFPIKKKAFEEFELSVPNKINNVLKKYLIDIDKITFKEYKINDYTFDKIVQIIIIIIILLTNF